MYNIDHHISVLKKIVLIVLAILSSLSLVAQGNIKNYRVYFALGEYNGKSVLIIRKYEQLGDLYYVAVNPISLETTVIPAKYMFAYSVNWQQIDNEYKNTPYLKAIQAVREQSSLLQNSGIIHGFPKVQGVTLTIDLCPSHKPLDRVIFTSLISEFQKTEKPVPLALSITGRFMLTHPDDVDWIKNLIASKEISVTWINHTFNHYYNPKFPLKENFLLEPNTNVDFEVLGTEISMLQHGFVFSVFFRFPGLVSDYQLVDKILDYGLIPVGSDAWLAKGQQAHSGSIVLIHGNGNEPLGVKDFINLLNAQKEYVMERKWLLYDLRESIENEFQ